MASRHGTRPTRSTPTVSLTRIRTILEYLDTPTTSGYPYHTLEALTDLHTICNDTIGRYPATYRNEDIPFIVHRALDYLNTNRNPHADTQRALLNQWVEQQEQHFYITRDYLPTQCPTCHQETLLIDPQTNITTCQQCGRTITLQELLESTKQ